MNIAKHIEANKPFISFEFFPPRPEVGWDGFVEVVKELKTLDPLFVSVTYGAGGTSQESTLDVAKRLKNEVGVEPIVHFTCVGASEDTVLSFLDELAKNDIMNVLALRGDPPQNKPDWKPEADVFRYGADLVRFIKKNRPEFCIGVAGYPEAHPESCTYKDDLAFVKEKLDAGGEFIVTQLFFDNRAWTDMHDRLAAQGYHAPIVPGVLPIMSLSNIRRILSLCGASIPGRFYLELEEADKEGGNEAVRKVGIDYAIRQCNDLVDRGAPGVHLYTLNKSAMCKEVVAGLTFK